MPKGSWTQDQPTQSEPALAPCKSSSHQICCSLQPCPRGCKAAAPAPWPHQASTVGLQHISAQATPATINNLRISYMFISTTILLYKHKPLPQYVRINYHMIGVKPLYTKSTSTRALRDQVHLYQCTVYMQICRPAQTCIQTDSLDFGSGCCFDWCLYHVLQKRCDHISCKVRTIEKNPERLDGFRKPVVVCWLHSSHLLVQGWTAQEHGDQVNVTFR